LVETVLVFPVFRVFLDAVDGADLDALRFVEMPYAFGAKGRVDFIDFLALGNRAVRAFGLADIAVDALVMND
jgi:hypothetical protein